MGVLPTRSPSPIAAPCRRVAPASIAALANGDIDYTLLTGSVIRGAIRGLPLRIAAGLMTSSAHVFLARPEIKTIKDLAGKRVAAALVLFPRPTPPAAATTG